MTFSTFIFSTDKQVVIARHITFWTIWTVYFAVLLIVSRLHISPLMPNIGSAIVQTCATTVLDIAYCYTIIYVLIPRFYFSGRFKAFFVSWLALSLGDTLLFRLSNQYFMPVITRAFGMPERTMAPFLPGFMMLFTIVAFMGCMCAAIVLGKHWYRSNQNMIQLKMKTREFLRNKKEKEIFSQHFILQSITKDLITDLEYSPYKLSETESKNNQELAIDFIETYFSHIRKEKVELSKEIDLLKKYLTIKENHFKLIYDVHIPLNDTFVETDIMIPLATIPFKNQQIINSHKYINISVEVKDELLLFTLSWHLAQPYFELNKEQLNMLDFLKNRLMKKGSEKNKISLCTSNNLCQLNLSLKATVVNQHQEQFNVG